MSDSDTTTAIIINLFSGLGGVSVGAWITYLLQEKSIIEKKKSEILSKILDRGYTGSDILSMVAQVAMIFKSQTIDTHLNGIIKVYSSRGGNAAEKKAKLKNEFKALAISMRDDMGISTEVLTNAFIKNTIEEHSYSN